MRDRLLPFPLLFRPDDFDKLAAAARKIIEAQTRILKSLLRSRSKEDILELFGVPDICRSFVDWRELTCPRFQIARFDIIPTESGYKFCEINWDSSVGTYEVADCFRVFEEGVRILRPQRWLMPQAGIGSLLRKAVEEQGIERIFICDWSSYRSQGYFPFSMLREHVEELNPGVDVRVVYEDGYGKEWTTGSRCLMFRGFMWQDMTDGGAFLANVVDSGAMVVNTFESEIRSSKYWFAVFHDAEHRRALTSSQREAIDRYIIQTRGVRAGERSAWIDDKDSLLFKKNISTNGKGLLFGAEADRTAVEDFILSSEPGGCTAQQVVASEQLRIWNRRGADVARSSTLLGLYLVNGLPSGMVVGHSVGKLNVNPHQGRCTGLGPADERSGRGFCIEPFEIRRTPCIAE